jgi:hypothetical protein
VTFHRVEPQSLPEPATREQRAVSAKQLKPTRSPKPKNRDAGRQPTRADFAAFLKERGIVSKPAATAQEKQALFREFIAWWSKR